MTNDHIPQSAWAIDRSRLLLPHPTPLPPDPRPAMLLLPRFLLQEEASSSDQTPPGPDDVAYYVERCSICFDHLLDFCLDRCKDQFCRTCFQSYVTEKVKGSWGLSRLPIKCPVCSDELHTDEWRRYVSSDLHEQYERYNRPFRPFIRHCPSCTNECPAIPVPCVPPFGTSEYKEFFHSIMEGICRGIRAHASITPPARVRKGKAPSTPTLSGADVLINYLDTISENHVDGHFLGDGPKEVLDRVISHFTLERTKSTDMIDRKIAKLSKKRKRIGIETGQGRYVLAKAPPSPSSGSEMADGLSLREAFIVQDIDLIAKETAIILQICRLEHREEVWRDMQFTRISHYPLHQCPTCDNDLCMQCGQGTGHRGRSCQEYLEERMRTISNADEGMDLQWQLKHSKPCPRCGVLIERDEGCNRVDCVYCSHSFCWMCQGSWGKECGFFACAKDPQDDDDDADDTTSDSDESSTPRRAREVEPTGMGTPEAGVPDIEGILARRSHIHWDNSPN